MVEQQAEIPVGCRFESGTVNIIVVCCFGPGTASLNFFEKGEYVWKSKS